MKSFLLNLDETEVFSYKVIPQSNKCLYAKQICTRMSDSFKFRKDYL